MRRLAAVLLLMLLAVILQTTLFARLTIFGVSPDLILVVVISFALLDGVSAGSISGFTGGMLKDLLLDAPRGVTGLSYLIVGYAVGSVRPYVQSTSMFVPVAAIFAGSLAGSLLYTVLSVLLGQQTESLARELQVAGLTAVFNTLVAPFVYPMVRRVAAAYLGEKLFKAPA